MKITISTYGFAVLDALLSLGAGAFDAEEIGQRCRDRFAISAWQQFCWALLLSGTERSLEAWEDFGLITVEVGDDDWTRRFKLNRAGYLFHLLTARHKVREIRRGRSLQADTNVVQLNQRPA